LQDFDYQSAATVDEVIRLIGSRPQVQLLSGGTDILVQLREGRKQAELVVDVKGVPDLCELAYDPHSGLRMGAALPCAAFVADPQVRSLYPGMVDAASLIGGTQIQSRASIGGNLCNASPAADAIPALIVHAARCRIAGPQGRRELAAEDFCVAPGKTALQPGEFLVSLLLPPPQPNSGAAYLRFIPRNEMDIAVVGAGAAVVLDETRTRFLSARVALGAVAPTPLFVPEAGEALAGREVSAEAVLEAARIAQAAARPISDMRGTAEQRRQLAFVLAKRALNRAIERAQSGPQSNHS
jgi:carbon-monoxide dehydrogenase medium subunit